MKAGKLLTLFTAVAVAATVGVSYAAWDVTKTEKTAAISISQQMKVEVQDIAVGSDKLAPAGTFAVTNGDALASVSAPLNVTIPSDFVGKADIKLAVTGVKDGENPVADFASIFTFTFKKGADGSAAELTDGTDTSAAATNAYQLVVAIKDNITDEQIAAIAGKSLTFTVSAEAVAHTSVV